jgi:tRNA threonylcarbamoyladenosine biosynthesis protein TsaE
VTTLQVKTASEAETEALGRRLAPLLAEVCLVYVRGPLGAGKTTLVRGLLRGLGYEGPVKSPTFSLLEPYEIGEVRLCHFDLYRITDPQELEYLALRDYIGSEYLCVIEWPERAGPLLPPPDLDVMIRPSNNEGRELRMQASTPAGAAVLRALR